MLGLVLWCLRVLLGGSLAKLRLCSHSGGILVWIGVFWCRCCCWSRLVVGICCWCVVGGCWNLGWCPWCPIVRIWHCACLPRLLCPWCIRIMKHSAGFVIWVVLLVWLVWAHCFRLDVLLVGSNFCCWPKNDVFPECPTPTSQRGGAPLPSFPPSTIFGFQ